MPRKCIKRTVYIGCLTHLYGPVVERVCFSRTWRTEEKLIPRLACIHTVIGILAVPRANPNHWSQAGISSLAQTKNPGSIIYLTKRRTNGTPIIARINLFSLNSVFPAYLIAKRWQYALIASIRTNRIIKETWKNFCSINRNYL